MGRRTNTAQWMEKQSRWQIKVQKDGQRRTFSSSVPGRTGQREANAKADAWLDDNIIDQNVRVEKLFKDYIEELKVRTSKSNWRNEDYRWRIYIKPTIGAVKISGINDQHLQNVINKAHAGGLSHKTLAGIRATLAGFFKYCRKRKATTYRPEDIIIPAGAPASKKKVLQPDDLKKLFAVNTTKLYGKIVYDDCVNAYRFQVLTGLRPGELLGLMWNDITGNIVYVRRSVNIYGDVTQGKNKNAIRSFALSQQAMGVLEDQRAIMNSIFVFGGITANKYRIRWKTYCETNELSYVSPYELRHTFVSIAKTLPEGQVKALVGHSRNMDTFGTYGHEIKGEQEKTAAKISELFDILTADKEKNKEAK